MNVGGRYDGNRSRDQTGVLVVSDGAFSPRIGATWDVNGDGAWSMHAGFARYVAALNTLIVDLASPGGRTANYSYAYQGPPVNSAPPYQSAEHAVPILFDWFFSSGGLSRSTRRAPVIPGTTRKIGSNLRAPNSHEYSIGISRATRRGVWRVDHLFRKYHDMYGEFINRTTGTVSDPTGRKYDLSVVTNDPAARRTYRALTASATYRVGTAHAGANYTLSWSRGNVDGEGPTTAFFRTMIGTYPEYRQARWNSPMRYTANDQRHKVRGWFSYTMPVPPQLGSFSVSAVQRFDSGRPYDAVGPIDPRRWVADLGYQTPPPLVDYYFSPRFGLRWSDAWNTDVSLNWSKRMAGGRPELFVRGVMTNVFNNSAVITGNSTVLTAALPGDLQVFNPVTDVPVYGKHWVHGPNFGQPIGPASFQMPRTFSCSAGVRF